MKKTSLQMFSLNVLLALALMLSLIASPFSVRPAIAAPDLSADLVISQVYGGGNNSGAPYNHDFVEIFNRGTSNVILDGKSIQYASASGTGNFSANAIATLSGSLAPGQYYLVQGAGGTTNGVDLPTPDATWTVNMGGSAGKVILANTTTGLACNSNATCAPYMSQIIDGIGYGTGTNATFYETALAPGLSNTTAGFRGTGGCTETDNNSTDFSAAAPSPRNTSTTLAPCATDTAPSVTSTTPSNGATGVAVDADVVVDFSENVAVTTSSFTIVCTSSSPTYALSGSGTSSVTLNPDSDFTNGDSCTVTVVANQVSDSDSDDPPDNMAADYIFSFDIVGAADSAPSVSSTSPANGATGVAADANVVVNFSETVDVTNPDSFTISCASSGSHTYGLSGSGTSSVTLNPDDNFTGGETCTVTVVYDKVSDSDTDDPPDNMAADYVFDFTINPDVCGGLMTEISAIQGSGATSPEVGNTVSTEGIVVGDFQGTNPGLNGFFIQDPTPDVDPATSEGIFVYRGPAVAVNVGDLVRVKGPVVEYNGLTEINIPTLILVCPGGSAQTPAPVTLPETTNGELEAYESMLVTIDGPFTVDQTYFLGRFGQVTMSVGGRMYNPTNGNGLGDTVDYNAQRMLVLDDGSTTQNPNPIPYYAADGALRAGDTTPSLTGVLDQGAINANATPTLDYRLHPTIAPVFTNVNLRTAAPDAVGGTLKVASFNVLNYFTTLDYPSGDPLDNKCGPLQNQECRGADSAAEFTRQRDKIIAALSAINADVFGLMEIENNPGDVPTADLVSGLNAVMGAGTYDYIVTGAIGSDAIRVALIYKPAVVSPVGSAATYQVAAYPEPPALALYTPLYDRPPLMQAFEQLSNGQQFAVIVNHFKSKGCDGASGVDLDLGYGCWNAKREAQSIKLLEYVNTLKGAFPSVLVIGDLNAYGAEPPIITWTVGGMVDEVATRVPADTRYTYVFDGQAGNLDQAIATPYLDTQVTGVTLWHINSDEPSVIDYNTEYKTVDLYTPSPYYASDHDPVIIGLNLVAPTDTYADDDGVCGGNVPCYTSIQAAIDAVAGGGTVHVYAGTYNESPDLNKNATVNIEGDITINGFTQSAGTFDAMMATITLLGDFTFNGGTFNAGSSTVVFAGSVPQVIGGSNEVTFNNLTINNPNGVSLGVDEEVEGTLTMMSGVLILGGYNLTLGDDALVVGSFDSTTMIAADGAGALCKEFDDIGSFTFPIGDLTGDADYSPFGIDFTGGTFVDGQVCVNLRNAVHPNLGGMYMITRYWSVISSGITGFSANVVGNYVVSDILGDEALLLAVKYDDPVWTTGGPVNAGDHSLSMTVTGFSDFTASNNPTAVIAAMPQLQTFHGALRLDWATANEANLLGFNVYRAASLDGKRQRLNPTLITAQAAGLPYGASYEFVDASVQGGQTYFYWIEIVQKDGTVLLAPVSAVAQFALYIPVIVR